MIDVTAAPAQLTFRAVATGMVIGAPLALCNLYGGLKVGWTFNLALVAAVLGFGFWRTAGYAARASPFGLMENNISQTTASSAALISSAGLVSAIPALTLLTGRTLSLPLLALWLFSVCLVGVAAAVALRPHLVEDSDLPFPGGVATAETLRELHSAGVEAAPRVKALLVSGAIASALTAAIEMFKLPKVGLVGPLWPRLYNLGFALDPAPLMLGIGAIAGLRIGASLLLGAVFAWGVLTPSLLSRGLAQPGAADAVWYGSSASWLVWPGTALMVAAALTSLALSWRSLRAAFRRRPSAIDRRERGRQWVGMGAALVLSVGLQHWVFGVGILLASAGVVLTFALAVVAGRIAAETAITPAGPLGKLTQLSFGFLAPGHPASNLMAANVTAGAATQCADLLQDYKTGELLGADPRKLTVAQLWGVVIGALTGAAAYLALVPDPQKQLLSDEWPAPAAASWRAVASLFANGVTALPEGALAALGWAGAVGIGLSCADKFAPKGLRPWVPSASAVGAAFLIPAYSSVSVFLGAALAAVVARRAKGWGATFLVIVAAGLIAGESLTQVGFSLYALIP